MELAPIVLFVYNRLLHTKQTIEALTANDLASDSRLYIYCDGHKNDIDKASVAEVRDYIGTVVGFKEVVIIERTNNIGLAASIIDGVTRVVNLFGKVIVLEDDIVTAPSFLTFMNDALQHYETKSKVMHICGWSYPIETEGLTDTFLWRAMDCWGWATWADRWRFFEKDIDGLIRKFDKKMIYKFNLDRNHGDWNQVLANKQGKLNTWGIFWYASIFLNNGLCLSPARSYVRNIGLDGSGENCIPDLQLNSQVLTPASKITFPDQIIESELAVERIKKHMKSLTPPLPVRISNKLLRIIRCRVNFPCCFFN